MLLVQTSTDEWEDGDIQYGGGNREVQDMAEPSTTLELIPDTTIK